MKIKTELKIRPMAGIKVVVAPGTPDGELLRVAELNETSEWLWKWLARQDFTEEAAICDCRFLEE